MSFLQSNPSQSVVPVFVYYRHKFLTLLPDQEDNEGGGMAHTEMLNSYFSNSFTILPIVFIFILSNSQYNTEK